MDSLIKNSADTDYVKNLEVKKIISDNPSQMAKEIKKASIQIQSTGDPAVICIYLEKRKNDENGRKFALAGFEEAKRKGWNSGPVEVWFNDKTKLDFN